MNKNVKIAKALIKLAKDMIIAERVDYDSEGVAHFDGKLNQYRSKVYADINYPDRYNGLIIKKRNGDYYVFKTEEAFNKWNALNNKFVDKSTSEWSDDIGQKQLKEENPNDNREEEVIHYIDNFSKYQIEYFDTLKGDLQTLYKELEDCIDQYGVCSNEFNKKMQQTQEFEYFSKMKNFKFQQNALDQLNPDGLGLFSKYLNKIERQANILAPLKIFADSILKNIQSIEFSKKTFSDNLYTFKDNLTREVRVKLSKQPANMKMIKSILVNNLGNNALKQGIDIKKLEQTVNALHVFIADQNGYIRGFIPVYTLNMDKVIKLGITTEAELKNKGKMDQNYDFTLHGITRTAGIMDWLKSAFNKINTYISDIKNTCKEFFVNMFNTNRKINEKIHELNNLTANIDIEIKEQLDKCLEQIKNS